MDKNNITILLRIEYSANSLEFILSQIKHNHNRFYSREKIDWYILTLLTLL